MTSSCTSSLSSNVFSARCFFRWRNKWKSLGAWSGLYGRWANTSHLNFSRNAVVMCAEWGRALSWSRHMPCYNIPLLLFWMACRSRVKVSQYAAALIVAPGGMKSTRRIPFLSQKMDAMIFFTEMKFWIFWFWWNACSAIAVTVAWNQKCGEKPIFHLQSQGSPENHLPVHSMWETSAWNPSVSFCDHPLTFWAPSVRTIFCTLSFLSHLHELWS